MERVEGVWGVGGGGGGGDLVVLQGFLNPVTPEELLPYTLPMYIIGPSITVAALASWYLHAYIGVGLCD